MSSEVSLARAAVVLVEVGEYVGHAQGQEAQTPSGPCHPCVPAGRKAPSPAVEVLDESGRHFGHGCVGSVGDEGRGGQSSSGLLGL